MATPPFKITSRILNLVAEISAKIERYAILLEQDTELRLRKANRIKTIHSSLAIEGNELTEGQVRDIINGKNVVAPLREIQEVKNAIATYDLFPTLNPFDEKDLLRADREFGIIFGKEFGIKFGIKFGNNDKRLLLLMNSNPTFSSQMIADRLDITKRAVEKIIKRLRESSVIERIGSNKSGYWKINRPNTK